MGDDTRLELQLPDVPCQLNLTTLIANADVRTADEQFFVKRSQPTEGGGSRIEVEGPGGILRLDWRATRHFRIHGSFSQRQRDGLHDM